MSINLLVVSEQTSYFFLLHRQKSRASQQGLPTPPVTVQAKGPDEDKIKAILERTGYTLDVTTGQSQIVQFNVRQLSTLSFRF